MDAVNWRMLFCCCLNVCNILVFCLWFLCYSSLVICNPSLPMGTVESTILEWKSLKISRGNTKSSHEQISYFLSRPKRSHNRMETHVWNINLSWKFLENCLLFEENAGGVSVTYDQCFMYFFCVNFVLWLLLC